MAPGRSDNDADRTVEQTGRWPHPDGDAAGAPPVFALDIVYSVDSKIHDQWLHVDGSLTVGRGEVALRLDDQKLSREHCVFSASPQGVWSVRDLDSRNGCWVNGERTRQRPLRVGDVVRFGDTVAVLAEVAPPTGELDGMAVRSSDMVNVVGQLDAFAPTELPVLVVGETGTGKEVCARYLHAQSGRTGKWVAVNCAAIPENLVESTLFGHRAGAFTGATSNAPGLLEEARGGTLFLDEVTELALSSQPKLLRALDNQEYTPVGETRPRRADVRLVCATNADVSARVAAGTFRSDLFARLAGCVLHLKPLRERRRDIIALACHFQNQSQSEWNAGFVETLILSDWPTNARGLRSALSRATVLAAGAPLTKALIQESLQVLDVPVAPSSQQAPAAAKTSKSTAPPAEELISALTEANGIVSRVAKSYGKDPKQIYRWLRKLGIDPDEFRDGPMS